VVVSSSMLKHLFSKFRKAEELDNNDHLIKCAAVALLIEIMQSDYDSSEEEQKKIFEITKNLYDLDDSTTNQIIDDSNRMIEDAVSLQGFTRTLHENCNQEEKESILRCMWEVATADGIVDKFEDHLISKLADLLYIERSRLMKIRSEYREL